MGWSTAPGRQADAWPPGGSRLHPPLQTQSLSKGEYGQCCHQLGIDGSGRPDDSCPQERELSRAAMLAWLQGRPGGHLGEQLGPCHLLCRMLLLSQAGSYKERGQARRKRPRASQVGAASGQAHLGVLQEENQFLGHGVQLARAGILEEVALAHKIVLQKVLAHTLVQLPYEAQEGFAECLPVLQVGVFLTGPEEHGLWKEEVVSDIGPGNWRRRSSEMVPSSCGLGRREKGGTRGKLVPP